MFHDNQISKDKIESMSSQIVHFNQDTNTNPVNDQNVSTPKPLSRRLGVTLLVLNLMSYLIPYAIDFLKEYLL